MRACQKLVFDKLNIIGLLVLAAGLYYLAKEKEDREAKKIYSIVSAVGGIIAAVCAAMLIIA